LPSDKPLVNVLEEHSFYYGEKFAALVLPPTRLASIEFLDCEFFRCRLPEWTFSACSFTRCRFVECDLSLAKVTNSTFVQVEFQKTKLLGIDWTQANPTLFAVSYDECALDYGSFLSLNLEKARLTRCTAREADFSEANLSDADCRGTDFTLARFLHTNLGKANFVDAANYSIDPMMNRVNQARFSLPEAIALLQALDIVIEDVEGS
jgi:fluoroquinolone resistance protein